MLLPALILAALPIAQEAQAPPPPPPPAASPAQAQSDIDAGLAAFRRLRFSQAEASFQKATEEDPTSAAAMWYYAYSVYKIAEPKRPFHPDKQRAADLFAKAYALDPTFKPVWNTGRAAPPPPPPPKN